MTVAITLDVDWAPDPVIEDAISLLDSFEIPATVFSTHADGVSLHARHERAIHPNFLTDDESTSAADVLDSLASLYPDASGLRSHSMYVHTRLREGYADVGIDYESNYLLYGRPIEPVLMYPGVVQFPVSFMDDMWLRRGKPIGAGVDLLDGQEVGTDTVVVYDFHPIHVYLNSPSIDHYEEHKDRDPTALAEARADGHGVRDAFRDVLSAIERLDLATATLGTLRVRFDDDGSCQSA